MILNKYIYFFCKPLFTSVFLRYGHWYFNVAMYIHLLVHDRSTNSILLPYLFFLTRNNHTFEVNRVEDDLIAAFLISGNIYCIMRYDINVWYEYLTTISTYFCSIAIGFASMIPVILYPLAKRYTLFPQVVLALTFNIGAIMGYVAVTNTFNWTIVAPLYASCFMWTIYYDTVYAMHVCK